ncbi:MAG: hypothetical protein M3Y71_08905 [Actinomycetota bacterium]|nr:hypothetical protein [Actinomycetota bacterium]
MTRPHRPTLAATLTKIAAITAITASLLLAGCASTVQPSSGSATIGPNGSGAMMGGQGQGYHYSTSTCAAPATLHGSTVRVVLADMGMTQMMGGDAPMGARMTLAPTPGTVAPGAVSLVAQNLGWRTHELVVLPLAAGAVAGERVPGVDGRVDEAGSLGESSASCAAGSGEGIASGAVGWTTLTLAPGRYELVCNLKNHYANGMYHELDVR